MSSRQDRKKVNQPEPVCNSNSRKTKQLNRFVIAGLIILFGVVYLSTILPGVSSGDSAELQYLSPLLGVCHPPGYQIEITFGKLFSILPIGPDIAWRLNFMMAVFGTIGCLSLYGAVRRICSSIVAGAMAATTLGFSSVYWTHCLHTEAYVFYGTFLLLGIYTAARFIESDKAAWLYLTALFLGACVADRSSEMFVLPAFFVLWLFVRKKIKLNVKRIVISFALFVLPFVYTTGFFLVRSGPKLFHTRENVLRYQIKSGDFSLPQRTVYQQVQRAVRYCLGLTYAKDANFDGKTLKRDVDKYVWLLSGLGAFGDRYPPSDHRHSAQGRGTSIGLLGILLAIAAIVSWRRQCSWVLFGFLIFLGNLIFILWHSRWDNLTFIIPGLVGLSFLVGLGAGAFNLNQNRRKQIILQAGCLVVPLFLLVTNYHLLDKSNHQEQKLLEYHHKLAAAPLPKNSVIIDTYWPAMTYRYLYYIESDRTDIYVMYAGREEWQKLIEYFDKQRRPVFINIKHFSERNRQILLKRTPDHIAQLGFVLINPGSAG